MLFSRRTLSKQEARISSKNVIFGTMTNRLFEGKVAPESGVSHLTILLRAGCQSKNGISQHFGYVTNRLY